jgi:hypothetical protein
MIVEKKLTTQARKGLKKSSFVFPGERKYPIHDKAHARNALSRVSANGTPAEKAKVRAAVHRKFPGIGKGKDEGITAQVIVNRLLENVEDIPVFIDYEGPQGKSTMAANLSMAEYDQMNVEHNMASLWADLQEWAKGQVGDPNVTIVNVRKAVEPHENPEINPDTEEVGNPY